MRTLYALIVKDSRHENVRLIDETLGGERLFEGWGLQQGAHTDWESSGVRAAACTTTSTAAAVKQMRRLSEIGAVPPGVNNSPGLFSSTFCSKFDQSSNSGMSDAIQSARKPRKNSAKSSMALIASSPKGAARLPVSSDWRPQLITSRKSESKRRFSDSFIVRSHERGETTMASGQRQPPLDSQEYTQEGMTMQDVARAATLAVYGHTGGHGSTRSAPGSRAASPPLPRRQASALQHTRMGREKQQESDSIPTQHTSTLETTCSSSTSRSGTPRATGSPAATTLLAHDIFTSEHPSSFEA